MGDVTIEERTCISNETIMLAKACCHLDSGKSDKMADMLSSVPRRTRYRSRSGSMSANNRIAYEYKTKTLGMLKR